MPPPGEYIFEVAALVEGFNPIEKRESVKATLTVLSSDDEAMVGRDYVIINITSGRGADAGLQRVKAMVMAAAGFTNEVEFDSYNVDGLFIAACLGADNDRAGDELLVTGRKVACIVTRGKTREDGDFYRECQWVAVDQDTCQPIA